MSYWSHNPELLDEITIENLPEPYKTWCIEGEKPYPWWKRWPRNVRYLFEKYILRNPKAWEWLWGETYFTSDVPDEILFPAMKKGEEDYWADLTDQTYERFKSEEMEAYDKGPEAIKAFKRRWGRGSRAAKGGRL